MNHSYLLTHNHNEEIDRAVSVPLKDSSPSMGSTSYTLAKDLRKLAAGPSVAFSQSNMGHSSEPMHFVFDQVFPQIWCVAIFFFPSFSSANVTESNRCAIFIFIFWKRNHTWEIFWLTWVIVSNSHALSYAYLKFGTEWFSVSWFSVDNSVSTLKSTEFGTQPWLYQSL